MTPTLLIKVGEIINMALVNQFKDIDGQRLNKCKEHRPSFVALLFPRSLLLLASSGTDATSLSGLKLFLLFYRKTTKRKTEQNRKIIYFRLVRSTSSSTITIYKYI